MRSSAGGGSTRAAMAGSDTGGGRSSISRPRWRVDARPAAGAGATRRRRRGEGDCVSIWRGGRARRRLLGRWRSVTSGGGRRRAEELRRRRLWRSSGALAKEERALTERRRRRRRSGFGSSGRFCRTSWIRTRIFEVYSPFRNQPIPLILKPNTQKMGPTQLNPLHPSNQTHP
uniref:Uncharacterized protein n=1 Tax=Leersia perrieri TaxID=77586 RepID=A0A0D9XNZ7_9ORYZ